jgi:hypothetical protein
VSEVVQRFGNSVGNSRPRVDLFLTQGYFSDQRHLLESRQTGLSVCPRVTVRVRDGLPDRARSGHARAESTGLQRVGDLTRGVRSSPRSGTLRASPGSPGTARVCPQGRSKRALAVPGGSGVGLCLPGRGDDPLLHLRGRAGVRGRAPRYADGFTGSWRSCRRELDCQLGKSVALYCRHLAVC